MVLPMNASVLVDETEAALGLFVEISSQTGPELHGPVGESTDANH
jgi:hypothetical protein